MINIDKNIPIPPSKRGHKVYKYPWLTMEVGDSFLAESINFSHVSALTAQARKHTGHKYTTRKEEHGIRVWRIE